jgi:rhodanese-related sulfurtransferase
MKKFNIFLIGLVSFSLIGCMNEEEKTPNKISIVTATPEPTEVLTEKEKNTIKEFSSEKDDPLQMLVSPRYERNLLEKDKFLLEWKNQNGVLIDLRTPQELKHLPALDKDAKLINFYAPNFLKRISSLDKKIPYFIYCAHANRSETTFNEMKKMGFKKVYELKAGIDQ